MQDKPKTTDNANIIDNILKNVEKQNKNDVAAAKEFILDLLNNNPRLTLEFLKIIDEKITASLEKMSKDDPMKALRSDLGIKESVYLGIGVKEEKLSGVLGKEDIFHGFNVACINIATDSLHNNLWDGISLKEKDKIRSKYPEGTFKDALYDVIPELYLNWVQMRSNLRTDEE